MAEEQQQAKEELGKRKSASEEDGKMLKRAERYQVLGILGEKYHYFSSFNRVTILAGKPGISQEKGVLTRIFTGFLLIPGNTRILAFSYILPKTINFLKKKNIIFQNFLRKSLSGPPDPPKMKI